MDTVEKELAQSLANALHNTLMSFLKKYCYNIWEEINIGNIIASSLSALIFASVYRIIKGTPEFPKTEVMIQYINGISKSALEAILKHAQMDNRITEKENELLKEKYSINSIICEDIL